MVVMIDNLEELLALSLVLKALKHFGLVLYPEDCVVV
jgi:hypothetical protein